MPKLTESVIEDAALNWLRQLGYDVLSGLASDVNILELTLSIGCRKQVSQT